MHSSSMSTFFTQFFGRINKKHTMEQTSEVGFVKKGHFNNGWLGFLLLHPFQAFTLYKWMNPLFKLL